MGQGTYRRLLKERRRDLSFGFLFFFLSCVGQTFFISNFGPTWREEFAVSDGLLGLCYFIATSLSALCLAVAGPLIDRTTLARYACGVVVFVACGCLIAAASPNIAVLCLALLMLRLGGQSLMIHVAMTSTARTFGNDKAKALALCIMGLGVAQAVTPGLLVIGIEAVGWRLSWVASGLVILCAGLAVVQLLPQSKTTANLSQGAKLPALAVLRDPRVIISMPVTVSASFVVTGFIFHQGRLAAENGWSQAWVAGWFACFAITQSASLLLIGPVIDKVGAVRLLPVFMLPMALAMLLFGTLDSPYVLPFAFTLMAVSGGVAPTLATALWVELFGPDRLGGVRSIAESGNVIASGLAPAIIGSLVDCGVTMRTQAFGCLVYILVASALAQTLRRKGAAYQGMSAP